MEVRNQTRKQAIVTILSLTLLVGFAAAGPRMTAPSEQPQSFIGTTPDATTVEELPAQF
jgi:hypothetical protein